MKKQDALDFYKGVKKDVALAADRVPGAVSQWGNVIPKGAAENIEMATKGRKGALKVNLDDYDKYGNPTN